MCGIYKITNRVNSKCYIGQSIDIKKRWRNHKNDAFNVKATWYNCPLYQAFRKYGLDSFDFEVLEECEPFELDEKETFYIAKFDTFGPNGYNLTSGGQAIKYDKLSQEVVTLIICRLKTTEDSYQEIADDFNIASTTVHHINNGKCYYDYNEEYPIREPLGKLAAYHNNCLICGKVIEKRNTHCVKCSNKLNNFKLRRVKRPEPIDLAKLVIDYGFVQVGKMFGVSDNSIKKWLKSDGVPHKKDELIAWYNEQIGIVPEVIEKRLPTPPKPVKQIDPQTHKVIQVFDSLSAAARAVGKPDRVDHISDVCKGKHNIAYGYIWEYA